MNRFNSSVLVCALFTAMSGQANQNTHQQQLNIYLKQASKTFLQQLPTGSITMGDKGNAINQWIESSEVRISAENDDDSTRSLALNLKIKNRSELNIQQQLFALLKKSDDLNQQKDLNAHLDNIYSQLLDLDSKLELLEHLTKQSSLAALEIKYQRDLVQSNDFDPENLLESELNQDQIRLQIELNKQHIDDLTQSLNFNTNKSFLDLSAMQIISRVKQYTLQNSMDTTLAHQDLELAKLKLKQQQSGEGFALNAFQIKSDFSHDKDTVLGMRFDIQIPFSGPNYDHRLKQQEITKALKRLFQHKQQSELKAIQSLQAIESMNKELIVTTKQAQRLEQRLAKTTNIKLILKLKKLHLNRLGKLISIKHNLRSSYLDFLAQRGLLASQQNNWLAAKLNSDIGE